MAYVRPVNKMPLSKQHKVDLLTEYAAYYRDGVAADDTALNRKIPRDAFISLLDRIGSLLIDESARLAAAPGPVRDFLAGNPLPKEMAPLLPVTSNALGKTRGVLLRGGTGRITASQEFPAFIAVRTSPGEAPHIMQRTNGRRMEGTNSKQIREPISRMKVVDVNKVWAQRQ